MLLEENAFGESGHEIVIEEMLDGEEVSIHAVISGNDFLCLPPSQDHKRISEGDTGLNTGGMGAYSPTSRITSDIQAEIEAKVIRPTIKGFQAEGIDFRGTLYAGLMLTESGVRVLEYNVRFGDPETQVLLPMVEDDLVPILLASAKGEPLPKKLNCHPGAAIVVVLAAEGYPGSYRKGNPITLPLDFPDNVSIVHAGTRLGTDGVLSTNGGRVLAISGKADNLQAAAELSYSICDQVHFEDKYFRRDIGYKELHR